MHARKITALFARFRRIPAEQTHYRELLDLIPAVRIAARPHQGATWARDELLDAWRAAHGEACRAYQQWTRDPAGGRFIAYRAAQDRADAAQDALAGWSGRWHAARPGWRLIPW
jgi:hypothetical protein